MKAEIENVDEIIERIVKPIGNGCHASIPFKWLGRKVKIAILKQE
jgi:putative transposon-encoded protein